jgi:hypothetical protein
MPWRRKPASWLEYWSGGSPLRTKAGGFRTVLVYLSGAGKAKELPTTAAAAKRA